MRQLALGCAATCLLALTAAAAAADRAPYVWPAPPGQEEINKALAMKSQSGFVVLDRQCKLEIRSFQAKPMGTTREEFIRFLIVSDEGARHAVITVNDDPAAKIDFVEGRTIAPGGSVTAVDEKRDVKRIDVTRLRRREFSPSLAEVAFPAPVKGAVLDLHYSTTRDGQVLYYVQPLVYASTPLLATTLDLTIKGAVPGFPWSALTVGAADDVVDLQYQSSGTITLKMAPFTPAHRLPFDPPAYQLYPTLICSLDLASLRMKGNDTGALFRAFNDVDSQGRISSVEFPSARHREYWGRFLADGDKEAKKFLAHPGAAEDIDVAALAPPSLPVEERAARLYRAAQERADYRPDAESVSTLSALMKKGMSLRWQGTLLYSYLLDRAHIPHRVGMVADRNAIRFTAVVRNEYLFDFERIVMIEPEGKPPIFAIPGYLGLPFGCLPDFYQDSVALFPVGENDLEYKLTPVDASPQDAVATRYDLELDRDGNVSGKAALHESGAPALWFFRWNEYRLYRKLHPGKEDVGAATSEKDKQDRLERTLLDEFDLPGDKLQLVRLTAPSGPVTPEQSVEISADAYGKGIAVPAQGKWVMYANPAFAGFTNPFGDEVRMTPVWYGKGGHFVIEGETKLPAGATVVELPRPVEFSGPLEARAASTVEKVERDGRTFVRARVEYDRPLVIGSDQDAAWRAFQTRLAQVAQDRCIITLPAKAKELE